MKTMFAKCGLMVAAMMTVGIPMTSCEKNNNKSAVEIRTVSMPKENTAYEAAVMEQLAAMQRGGCMEMTLHLEQTDDSYILTSGRHNKK